MRCGLTPESECIYSKHGQIRLAGKSVPFWISLDIATHTSVLGSVSIEQSHCFRRKQLGKQVFLPYFGMETLSLD